MIKPLNPLNFAETRPIFEELRQGAMLSVFGMNHALKTNISAHLDGTVLYICSDLAEAGKIRDSLIEYLGEGVEVFPEREDVLLSQRTSQVNVHKRLGLIKRLTRGELKVLIATPESLVNYLPKVDRYQSSIIELDGIEGPEALAHALVKAGYVRETTVEAPGSFSVRGDVLDVYPVDSDMPMRIEYFGDEIERVRYYDEELRYYDTERVVIPPATDVMMTPDERKLALQCVSLQDMRHLSPDAVLKKSEVVDRIVGMLSGGAEPTHWLFPFIEGDTLYDYLPEDSTVVYDEPKQITDKYDRLMEQYLARIGNLIKDGELIREHFSAFVPRQRAFVGHGRAISFHGINSINPVYCPTRIFRFVSTPITKYFMDVPALYKDVRNWLITGYRVILCAGSQNAADAISKELRSNDIPASTESTERIYVSSYRVGHGFVLHGSKMAVIGTNELVRRQTKVKVKRKSSSILPESGDYVVHDLHGIGIYQGIVKIPVTGGESDFAEVVYTDGKVYVPVHQMDVLDRYTAGDKQPKLSRIGGKDFSKIKERVKASIKEMAIDLLELYSERKEAKGFRYSEDTELQREFEEAFPYEETEDQLEAVRDIKSDMEAGRIMDRLVAGDVGYGKTEVALRAVFKAVCDGKQCAILAPTTVLSEQHYNTAVERLKPFGVTVACVNRFRKPSEIRERLSELKNGNLNVICGTHRLLSKDVVFNDLGLLVLDEEQRFGVEDKERIKEMKRDVDVITLSATPIPRTLHLSLTGIRDISMLETPPKNRLPVETAVTEYSDSLVRDALTREIARGGQAFVLYNRVENINNFAARIAELVPGIRVTVAHGQMDSATLESRIREFYAGETDVLVSTTIIENGIDLPSANTLVVCDADRLGLAQLYQLRGRVGRSDRLAYAYFTYREGSILTETAYKRLSAIMDYTELGSGYKIAMRDLEIRGAGNILGREQHGHMEKVGYDMYCRLLKETIEELRGSKRKKSEVEIRIDIPANIPEYYVPVSRERMNLYKQIASLDNVSDYELLIGETARAYGEVAEETVNLMKVSLIKNLASGVGAAMVVNNRKGAGIKFTKDAPIKRILYAASTMESKCVLSDNPLTAVFDAKNHTAGECNDMILKFLLATGENL